MAKEFTDIHALIKEVAKNYQYRQAIKSPDWWSSLWNNIQQLLAHIMLSLLSKLNDFVSGISKFFKGSGESSKQLAIICLVVVLLITILIAIWQQRRWLKTVNWKKNEDSFTSNLAILNSSMQWRQQALMFSQEGRFAEACRYLHRACLQLLDEANLLKFIPARANFEYVTALAALPKLTGVPANRQLQQKFRAFSNVVDAIYFGNRPAGESEFQLCMQNVEEIETYVNKIKTYLAQPPEPVNVEKT